MVYMPFIYLRDLLTFYLSSQIQVHGVRIVQLTSRTTSVMTVSEVGELSAFDPVLNAFRVLGQLYNLAVSQPRWYKGSYMTVKPLPLVGAPAASAPASSVSKTHGNSFFFLGIWRSSCRSRGLICRDPYNESFRGILGSTALAMDRDRQFE
jgi:hypothetical protein